MYALVVFDCANLWTAAFQASVPGDSPGKNLWSRLPCPPPGDLPNPETEPASLMSPILAGGFFTTNTTWEAHFKVYKTVLLTVVTVQCIRSPEFISNYQFVTLTNISSVLPSLVPDSYCSTFCFYELNS